MAVLYANSAGSLLRLLKTEEEESIYGAPSGTVFSLSFDESANTALLAALDQDWNSHTMPSGTLQRNGSPVSISSAGSRFTARQQLVEAKNTILGNAAGLSTYRGLASPTNAQSIAAIKALISDVEAVTIILRALVKDAA